METMTSQIVSTSDTKREPTPCEQVFIAATYMLSELVNDRGETLPHNALFNKAYSLREIGFTKSYGVQKAAEYPGEIRRLMFMCEMWHNLGSHTILIDFEQFREILRRQDLMCVQFDSYTGDVPDSNLMEIKKAADNINIFGSKYACKLTTRTLYADTSEDLIDEIRFPFSYPMRRSPRGRLDFDYSQSFDSRLFIAASKENVKKPTVYHLPDYSGCSLELYGDEREQERERRRERDRLADEIEDGVGEYANVGTAPIASSTGDSLVCSLCDYGVIIHSMWGSEADDKIIKRYRELRDAVMSQRKSAALPHNP